MRGERLYKVMHLPLLESMKRDARVLKAPRERRAGFGLCLLDARTAKKEENGRIPGFRGIFRRKENPIGWMVSGYLSWGRSNSHSLPIAPGERMKLPG